jgi:hypothetical protein
VSGLRFATAGSERPGADGPPILVVTTSEAVPGKHVEAHVGDVDPLQAIEDAFAVSPSDEIVVVTAPDEQATWFETGLGEQAQERFSVPVRHLGTG